MTKRQTKEWEVSAFDRENNEWTTTMNHAYEVVPEIPEFVSQAPPLKITPTRRATPESEFETLLFYGDTHHPFQDERAMNLAQLAILEYAPDVVTFIGDDTDMANFSRFETRQEWADSTQEGIDQFSARLAQVRADLGKNAVILAHEGNHDMRLAKELRKYNGELLGIKRANAEHELGVLTLGFLLRCDEIGVEYLGGYPAERYWHTDNLMSYHGDRTAAGSVIAKELLHYNTNFIHGHGHRWEHLERTFQNGRDLKTIWGVQLPTFALQDKIPSGAYSTTPRGETITQAQNWSQGLALVRAGEEGEFVQHIPITDEGIMLEGKWYKS